MFLSVQNGILLDQRCFNSHELIRDTVAVVQVNRGYFLWLSVLTKIQIVGVEFILCFSFFNSLCTDPRAAKEG